MRQKRFNINGDTWTGGTKRKMGKTLLNYCSSARKCWFFVTKYGLDEAKHFQPQKLISNFMHIQPKQKIKKEMKKTSDIRLAQSEACLGCFYVVFLNPKNKKVKFGALNQFGF